MQEVLWRRYWKTWLEWHPLVWRDWLRDVAEIPKPRRVSKVESGKSGVAVMDAFARQLIETGYLHNHARMWFAAWWVHVERLPWQLGTAFFLRHLLDGDAAARAKSAWGVPVEAQSDSSLAYEPKPMCGRFAGARGRNQALGFRHQYPAGAACRGRRCGRRPRGRGRRLPRGWRRGRRRRAPGRPE